MIRNPIPITLVISFASFCASSLRPASAEDFHKGKTLRFIVGYAPGGGYDTYTRAVARYIGRHIPGNPSIVVENMEGAGSLFCADEVDSPFERSARAFTADISIRF